jgi:hypothetical protein
LTNEIGGERDARKDNEDHREMDTGHERVEGNKKCGGEAKKSCKGKDKQQTSALPSEIRVILPTSRAETEEDGKGDVGGSN